MGVVDRLVLDDKDWSRIAPHIIGDERSRGTSGRDNRMFIEAVLWIVRTGSPWRDLPEMQPHAFELFLDALVGKENVPLVSPAEAARSCAVMEALYAASGRQEWVAAR